MRETPTYNYKLPASKTVTCTLHTKHNICFGGDRKNAKEARQTMANSHNSCRSGLCRKAWRDRRRRPLCASSRSRNRPSPSSADSSSAPSSPCSPADSVAISLDDRSLRRHIRLERDSAAPGAGRCVLTALAAPRRRAGQARVAADSASSP